jgi:large subunit ribosomal protein L6
MSRIGKKPIEIPQGVDVKIENQEVTIRGLKGELRKNIRPEIKIGLKERKLFLSGQNSAFLGLSRTLLANMVKGVIEGYEKKLEIEGIGYKANLEGQDLVLNVGFTHPVKIKAPEGIKFSVEKNVITVLGIDKQLVGQLTARIRAVNPPEPYKGKGIKYQGEQVRRKLGKRAAVTTAS